MKNFIWQKWKDVKKCKVRTYWRYFNYFVIEKFIFIYFKASFKDKRTIKQLQTKSNTPASLKLKINIEGGCTSIWNTMVWFFAFSLNFVGPTPKIKLFFSISVAILMMNMSNRNFSKSFNL